MSNRHKEILFQVVVHVIVFVFYSFEKDQVTIEGYKYAYFANYAITAAIINYVCLPIFYKQKNTLVFVSLVTALILSSVLLEEYVLEGIFFPGPRAETVKMLMAFISIIPVITILSGVKFGWDALMKQNEVDRLEEAMKDSELQFLKSQINPHFLFNTLNNLYALTLKKSDKAPDIVIKLSEMMRYMLYECNEKQVPLQKEVNYLRNYLDLERLRQSDQIKIEFKVDGIIGDQKIAPLLFIPFLENSFKHGLNTQLKDGFVKIQLNANEEMIDFYIENSKGQAIQRPDNRPSGGIGLVNVRRRLQLLYPDKYTLEVDNKPNSFAVHFTLEL